MGLEASMNQERIDLEIEKQTLLNSLSELDLDLAQGRLNPSDHQRLKAVDEARFGRILDKLDSFSKQDPPLGSRTVKSASGSSGLLRWAGSVTLGLVVVGSAVGIYEYITAKIGLEAQRRFAESGDAAGPQGMPNPAEMVAQLEQRLKNNPNDLQGQIMAGRSYMTLKRIDDAQKAWSKVVELDPGNFEGNFFLGLIQLQTSPPDDRKSSQEALGRFETALVTMPRDPAVLWYKGVALVRLKQYDLADRSWTTAFQNLTPGTEDAEFVKKALQSLRAGNPPAL
ncbi:MAG TPA: tetratricopeptide repeat protein [Nitrospiria bacterium]|nr:tetratricopeptide repeat protein [Nitrospiria bacterium]